MRYEAFTYLTFKNYNTEINQTEIIE